MSIQRYGLWQRHEDGESFGVMKPEDVGQYVLFSDHEKAVEDAHQRECAQGWNAGYEQAIRDCIDIVDAFSREPDLCAQDLAKAANALRALLPKGES